MDASTSFGAWLKRRRKELDLRQQDLADQVGCAMMTIQKIEAGERRPSRQIAALLAVRLQVPPDERADFVHFARFGSSGASAAPADAAAPWRTRRRGLTNLPVPTTALVGRRQTVAAVLSLLEQERVRLVTLSGPPGIGKTSLSLEVASQALDRFPDGVLFVALAALRSHDQVLAAIAEALGLHEAPAQSPAESVRAALQHQRRLVLLDNFEHLLDAAPYLGDLLASCPWLKLLVTSRAALRLRAERQFAVPPLDLPDLNRLPAPAALATSPAVALFVERAGAVAPHFALTATNAHAVARICVRLDGLPLAIELAAARIALFTPREIAERLDRRLDVLTGEALDLPPRHRTLRHAIGWSYALLEAAERRLFARFGVFVGGASLPAVEAVCDGQDDRSMRVDDAVAALVRHGLLRRRDDNNGANVRFEMLETIRDFALDRLAAGGETAEVGCLHATFYLALALEGARELRGPQQGAWLHRLEQEHANLRAALAWSATSGGDATVGLTIAASLGRFWEVRGHYTEGRAWLATMLRHAGSEPATDDTCGTCRGPWSDAQVAALAAAGRLAHRQGDYDGSRQLYQASLEAATAQEDYAGIAGALRGLGSVALYQSLDVATARPLFEQSLALYRAHGDRLGAADVLLDLVDVLLEEHDSRWAEQAEESLALFREAGDTSNIAMCLLVLSDDPRRQTDDTAIHAALSESLRLFQQLEDRHHIGRCLGELAWLAWRGGQLSRSARLFGATEALLSAIGARMHPEVRARFDHSIADLRARLSTSAFSAAWDRGQALTTDQAIEDAVSA